MFWASPRVSIFIDGSRFRSKSVGRDKSPDIVIG